ncbi:hypothetical protein Tsubulata_048003, partial [Turnera subulata]
VWVKVVVVVADEEIGSTAKYPLVVTTWPFKEAVRAAWRAAHNHGLSAVDAVVEGCSACEELRCDGTVGPGGSPDENGETTIDALVMDGVTMDVGAVAAMRYVKDGIKAAKLVMQHTKHTLLVGEQASAFAISMGLPGPTNLSSPESMEKWTKWKENRCRPNFRKNVVPSDNCGPYHLKAKNGITEECGLMGFVAPTSSHIGPHNHDTIAMAVFDKWGHVAVGTSTNGATFKIPGSYQVVESMRLGMEPRVAARDAISRIARKFPDFVGAIFAVNKSGAHAGACHGWTFQYSVRSPDMEDTENRHRHLHRPRHCHHRLLLLPVVLHLWLLFPKQPFCWKMLETLFLPSILMGCPGNSRILPIKLGPKLPTGVEFSNVYGVELLNHGSIQGSNQLEMYGFKVHGLEKSQGNPCVSVLVVYTFRHKDLRTCQMWVDHINASLKSEVERPKNLLVFVHPLSGKGKGYKTWETVAPIFSRAKVNTKVVVTERAGQAFDEMVYATNEELNSYDGGGDGFFNEILNGFLLFRHKAPYPPSPSDFFGSDHCNGNDLVHGLTKTVAQTANQSKDYDPLLSNSCSESARVEQGLYNWSSGSYYISIANCSGYGFYGDVITESEKYRWMGPKRYDYAGTKVFLRHRSYEAEVAYVETESEKTNATASKGNILNRAKAVFASSERVVCRTNCAVCNTKPLQTTMKSYRPSPYSHPEETRWRRCKGRFLSVGAAIISNRNEKAPDGLVADAHLSDGFLHLLLIRDCPRALYLWCMISIIVICIELTRRGGKPLNFNFVEHHKTSAFSFTSLGKESVWNLDGELFPAHKLSAQVFRGLVSLFASGPEILPFSATSKQDLWGLEVIHQLLLSWAIFTSFCISSDNNVMTVVPMLRSRFLGVSLVFMIVYIWGREFPNARISIYGVVSLKGFYLPWAMLALDLIFGNPLKPDILGMVAGHLYYFLTVLHPLSGGKFILKTPLWYTTISHKLVAYWGEGTQVNAPVQRDPSAGVAFRGRSYRLSGSQSRSSGEPTQRASAPVQQPNNPADGVAFRGRGHRLGGQ